MELNADIIKSDEAIRGAFKTFSGQAGYVTNRAGQALGSILSKEFLSNSVIHGGFKGAALGVGAGVMTTAVDRWMNPSGKIDNGVMNGLSMVTTGAGIGALGGIGATAINGMFRNIKNNFSTDIGRAAFEVGKEGGIGARAISFAGRRMGSGVFMGAAALGASAYIGGKVLKSIISTNLTKPSDGGSSAPNPLVHLI